MQVYILAGLVVATAVVAAVAYPCSTAWDCHLNGLCQAGQCHCDTAWNDGGNCSKLQLLPVETTPCGPGCAYHGENGTKSTSWGGSVVDLGSGTYAMLAAEMLNDCGLGTWRTNSQVAVATADTPTGPYKRLATAAPPWTHNPQVIVTPTTPPTFVLFTLGNGTVHAPLSNCTGESHLPTNFDSFGADALEIGLWSSASLHGPWTRHPIDFVDMPASESFTNPAPVMLPDGKVRVLIDIAANNGVKTVYEADTWQGPYKRISKGTIPCRWHRFKWCAEDPFMYQDHRGHWHALFHQFDVSPGPTPFWAGGHAFSEDGLTWSNITQAYNTTVITDDGKTYYAGRRERPKMLFDASGFPTHLFNGVALQQFGTYTLAQRIAHESNI